MPDWAYTVLATVVPACIGAYVGVKAALASLEVKIDIAAKEAERANERIDDYMLRQRVA